MEKYLEEVSKRFDVYSGQVYVDYVNCIEDLLHEVDEEEINEYWYVFWHPNIKPSDLQEPFIILDGPGKPLPIFVEDCKECLVPYLKRNYKGYVRSC